MAAEFSKIFAGYLQPVAGEFLPAAVQREIRQVDAGEFQFDCRERFGVGDLLGHRYRGLRDHVQWHGAGGQIFRFLLALPGHRHTRRRFLLQRPAMDVDPREHRNAAEALAQFDRRFEAIADADLFAAFDHDGGYLLGQGRRVEGRKVKFLAGFQLLGDDIGLERSEQVRRLGQGNLADRAVAGGVNLQGQLVFLHRATRLEADFFGVEGEIEALQDPVVVGFHFQAGLGGLDGAQEIQIEPGKIVELVAFGFRHDGLGSVADLFTTVKDAPPLFAGFGDLLRAAQRQQRRRRDSLAFDEEKIHHSPEKYDANPDRSLNNHRVERIW